MPNTDLATTEIIEINPPTTPETTLQKEDKRFLCRHIFTDGRRCGSPALLTQNFCYYHYAHRSPVLANQRRRQLKTGFDLTNLDGLDNPAAIQLSLSEIIHRLAANTIDPKRAGLILYGLQVAGQNLRRINPIETSCIAEDIVEDATFGQLAILEPGRTEPETHISRMLSGKYPPEDPPADAF